MRWSRAALAGVLGLALSVAACGQSDPAVTADAAGGAAEPAAAASATATSSTSSPPTTTPAGPPTVALAGDSVMRELSSGLVPALQGPAEASYVATPYIIQNPTTLVEWQQRMAADPPQLVVLLVGVWEGILIAQHYQEPGFADDYAEQARPFIEAVTGGGGEVLWVGYPPFEDEGLTAQFAALNQVWATFPDRFPRVHYVDGGAAVAPDGVFQLSMQQLDGSETLLRQSDGRHLCPEGVVRMGQAVLAEVTPLLGVEPVLGWEQAPWRHDPASFEHPELCPGAI